MVKSKGVPCGDSFISPRLTCHKGAQKFLEKIKESPPKRFPSSADQKRRVVSALEMAKNKEEQREIMRDVTNRLSPKQAQEILDRKMPNGMTFEEYANKRGSNNYNIPGQKQRVDVTDDEVDHFWDSLSTVERNLLVPAGAGAPEGAPRTVLAAHVAGTLRPRGRQRVAVRPSLASSWVPSPRPPTSARRSR